MKRKLEEELNRALLAKQVWQDIIKDDTSDYILLFYTDDLNILETSIHVLLSLKYNKRLKVLTVPKYKDYFSLIIKKNYNLKIIDNFELENIILLNNLYMFSEKLIIVSESYPSNRSAINLVSKGLISNEEYIRLGIFKTLDE